MSTQLSFARGPANNRSYTSSMDRTFAQKIISYEAVDSRDDISALDCLAIGQRVIDY